MKSKRKSKKKTTLTKRARKIGKLLNEAFKISPNVYGFLIDHGISDEIADKAQNFVSGHAIGRLMEIEMLCAEEIEELFKSIERAREQIEAQLEDIREALE